MINTPEIVEIGNAGVFPEQRKPLPHQQKWAIKLSFFLHVVLITGFIIMNRHTVPQKYPLIIDFTVESAELHMEKKSDPGSFSPTAGKETAHQATPPVAPIHSDSHELNGAGKSRMTGNDAQQTLPRQMRPAAVKRLVNPAKPLAPVSSAAIKEEQEQTSAHPSSTAFTSTVPTNSETSKPDNLFIAPPAGNNGNPPLNLAATSESSGLRNEEKQYLRKNFDYIRNLIMRNLTFPATARKLGWTGKILVSFIVREDGNVEDINILSSSGHEVLDSNVVAAIRRTAPFPEPRGKARFMLPIVYSLK